MPIRPTPRRDAPSAPAATTHPRPWEEEPTFSESLYEWTRRAPWIAISAALHVIVLLVLTLFPWSLLERPRETVIATNIDPRFDEPFETPPPETPPEVVPAELPTEPVWREAEANDPVESPDDMAFTEVAGEPDELGEVSFDGPAADAILGIGGGWSGKFGNRGRGGRRPSGGRDVQRSITDGLAWLAAHQDPGGGWSAAGFEDRCPSNERCGGPGAAEHDVGVSGLALLAFLGEGNSTLAGTYRESVTRAVRWLLEQQDPDSGLIGEPIGHAYLYDHAIATVALCEAYYASKSPILKPRVQSAVHLIGRARNPYSAWRYDLPPSGDNDTSVTGWMVMALVSARDAGLRIDSAALDGALSWIDEMTDPVTGRVGYTERGGISSRVPGVNDHYPTDRTETMTAVGLLSRVFLGQDPMEHPILERHADLLLRALPEWDPDGLTNDLYYWYYGSYAAFQMGGRHWKAWNRAMQRAVIESQRRDGHARGSWDPIGPWGYAGGRVYSTALGVLCLEVYFRYARIIGAR